MPYTKNKLLHLFLFILMFFIGQNIPVSFAGNSSDNPLRSDKINSFIDSDKNYPQIYSTINELILNKIPVLIKNDIDNYLNDISREVTVKVVDNKKSKPFGKYKKRKSDDEKKNHIKKKPNITFDFPNISLSEFARFVARLNKKLLIGENQLQGKLTIKTPKKLTLKRLMKVFKALLDSRGLSYHISGKYMQIYQKSTSEVRVYQIDYLKAENVAKSLSEIYKMSFRAGGKTQRIMINSLDDANCVVVLAPKSKQMEIKKAIDKLDLRRKQVLLNIKIIEITYSDKFGFGVAFDTNIGALTGGMGQNATKWKTNMGTDKNPNYWVPKPKFDNISNPYLGAIYNNQQFLADIEASQYVSNIKILNQPRLLTSENQKAEINVGSQEPIEQAQTNMGTSSSNLPTSETTVDWKRIGVKVNITPRINSKNDVTLDFKMSITSIVERIDVGSFTNYPVIGQRITENTSTVKDNHSLILGGLLKDLKTTAKYQVPFLGDIPMLGWLFTSYQEVTEQTELIIIITPKIIANTTVSEKVTQESIDTIKNYDKSNKEEIQGNLDGSRRDSWDIFSLYDYFNKKGYKKRQTFIPQQWEEND
ncbi:MAG: hypothetical protein K9L78_04480 [Victivallales bacterium]|nr:hypothetical protein [Victivallales bacterium]MCF7889360.1 hypothetical protein [Victivallales bacterium]